MRVVLIWAFLLVVVFGGSFIDQVQKGSHAPLFQDVYQNPPDQQHHRSGASNRATDNNANSPHPIVPGVIRPKPELDTAQNLTDNQRNQSPSGNTDAGTLLDGLKITDLITVIAACVGVGVAYSQLLTYKTQAKIMRGQLTAAARANKLTRDIFIASHRPIIAARGLFMYAQAKDKPIRLRFSIHNTGSSDARITDLNFFMAFNKLYNVSFPKIITERPALPVALKSGFNEVWIGIANIDLTNFRYEGDEGILTFRGRITYEDLSGRRRETSFDYEWDRAAARFRRVIDSEFNYTD